MLLLSIPNILGESMNTGVVDGTKVCATMGISKGIRMLECIPYVLDRCPEHVNIHCVSHALSLDSVFLSWHKLANTKDLVKFRVYMFKQVLHLWIHRLQVCREIQSCAVMALSVAMLAGGTYAITLSCCCLGSHQDNVGGLELVVTSLHQ